MGFKEFTSPEEKDFDITSSLKEANYNEEPNYNQRYVEELIELIGILEDINEEELIKTYGINLNEYFNPNAQTIIKVKEKLNITPPYRRSR